ncbi:hypothetical protein GF385_01555 [Candidatus Dependentiae bacterium]|nr:hypothetical protein [Candidatus Dependentiae bacterium]
MFKFFGAVFNKSKNNKSKLKLSKPQNSFLKHKTEAIAILLIAVFVILFLSLLSYSPTDKSWFYFSATNDVIKNWCGVVGANFSALLFYLFGGASYLFILGFAFLAYLLFAGKEHVFNRFIGFLFFTLSFSALLFGYNFDLVSGSLPGGLLGSSFFKLFTYPFGILGSKILHISIILASGIILSRVSFFSATKNIFMFSWNVLKLATFYFFKAAKAFINYLFLVILNFFKLFYSKAKELIKFIFTKKSEKENKIGEQFKFTRQKREVVWGDTLSKSLNDNLIDSKFEIVIEKFKSKQIYKFSRKICLSKFSFLLLPNTIFQTNFLNYDLAKKFSELISEKKEESKSINNITKPKIEYKLPDKNIFEREDQIDEKLKKELEEEGILKGKRLEEKLSYFGIKGKVTAIRPGPVITLFEYKPEIDSKISKIISLEDDLALALMALSIRIVAPIPGRSVVGFEISNKSRQKVFLSHLLNDKKFDEFKGKLPVVFGVDIVGRPVIQDLSDMPHLLVAGSTGSGKSVGLNTMLVSLLCDFSPEQLKLILIDPKRLEFAPYKDIPHLLFPIITNPRSASPVLKWLVQEMERRYDQMAEAGVRNISEYQDLLKSNSELEPMPFIILMIDELADLMMVAGKDIELHIARIAQMARAAGIHMVVATQRPSVDVVTGLIKVNFPSRIAFRVTSKIDSRTIVDGPGAEKLLGRGDMLYMNSVSSDLQRIHGAYVGVKEVEKLTSHLRFQAKPQYLDLNETLKEMTQKEVEEIEDDLYPEVVEFIKTIDELSISGLQRRYRIGFNRSARLIEKLEMDGFLAPAQGSKPRKILKENLQ